MPQIEPLTDSPPFPVNSPGPEESDPVAGPAVTAEAAARAAAITAHLGDALDAHDAAAVSVTALSSLAGSDVQAVLADLDTRVPAVESSNAGKIPASLVDAKGDLLVGSADNTVIRKAIGTDGQILTANAALAGGMGWAANATLAGAGNTGFLSLRNDFALNPSMTAAALHTAIQSAIVSAISAGKGIDLGADLWPIDGGALTVGGSLSLRAAGAMEVGSNGYHPGGAPWVKGGGLLQQSAGADILAVPGAGTALHLRDLCLAFGGASAFQNTGHGINTTPPQALGVQFCDWSNVIIFGHDGDHYGVAAVEIGFINANLIRTYGGGGWWLHNNFAAFAGNCVITNPYVALICEGTADGYRIDSTGPGPGGVVLTTFVRPQTQVVTAVGSSLGIAFGIADPPNLTNQYAYRDVGTQTQDVFLIAPNFEPTTAKMAMTAGTTTIGPELSYRSTTNVNLGKGAMPGVPVIAAGQHNTAIGFEALGVIDTSASGNTAVGSRALRIATGAGNVAVGNTALTLNTTGASNIAIGAALIANTTGGSNTALGAGALAANTTGSNHVAIGVAALAAVTTAGSLVAIGSTALQANTSGTLNTAIGANALKANTTAALNTAIGNGAMIANTTAGSNTAVGASALGASTTGTGNNTAVGMNALAAMTTGANNVAVGSTCLSTITTASNGVAVGYLALQAATGANNTAVGFSAGRSVVAGVNNTCVGYKAGETDGTTATTDNTSMTLIGENAQSTTGNVIVLGKAVATRPNMIFGGVGATTRFGGGVGVFHIGDAVTVPASNPTGGGILYSEGGALKWRGSGGTVTTIGPT